MAGMERLHAMRGMSPDNLHLRCWAKASSLSILGSLSGPQGSPGLVHPVGHSVHPAANE